MLLNFDSKIIGDNTFYCGIKQMNLSIQSFVYGQQNFQQEIQCNSNFTWSLNGSILIASQSDIGAKNCTTEDFKFIIEVPIAVTFEQQQFLQSNVATYLQIDPARLNITQRPDNENDGEMIFSILNGTDSEISSPEALYHLSSTYANNNSIILGLLNQSKISVNQDQVTTSILSFNETVGTQIGCFYAPSFTFLIGSTDLCTQQAETGVSVNPINYETPAWVYGISFGSLFVLIIAVLLVVSTIPGIRKKIFPIRTAREKLRAKVKKSKKKKLDLDSNDILDIENLE